MPITTPFRVRLATGSDAAALAALRASLWPEAPIDHHQAELRAILDGTAERVYPLHIFVAEDGDGRIVGFLEANLRSTADGCDERLPVGYVEGWFVAESWRSRGIGGSLLRAAEDWARAEGCVEMASDAAADNSLSQRVHEASGFAVAARSVLYKKKL